MNEEKYIMHLMQSELKEIIKNSIREVLNEIKQEETTKIIPAEKYSYGLNGLATLLGCSKTTAFKVKDSGKIDKAIRQIGRKIIVDNEMVLKLLGK